jgi:hypothetical protein
MLAVTSDVRRRRVAGVATLLAAVACGMGPAGASASQFGYEGSEIVARADPGEVMAGFEVTVDAAAGAVTATDRTQTGTAPFLTQRGAPRAGERCRNEVIERSTVRFQATVCPLAGALGVRIEWAGAVPNPGADRLAMPSGRYAMAVYVTGGSLPLVYQGGPGPEGVQARTSGAVVADTGDGDDGLDVNAGSGTLSGGAGDDIVLAGSPSDSRMQVDAGAGDDGVDAVVGDGSIVVGGPGDDRLAVSTWNSDPAEQARAPVRRQRVDCGEGADTLIADVRDVAGSGCATAPTGLRERMLLGRFDRRGRLRVSLGRLTRRSSVRYRIFGSEPPRFRPDAGPLDEISYGKPAIQTVKRVRGSIRARVRLLAKVRKGLRETSRRTVRNVSAQVDVQGAGAAENVTTVRVSGVLRRAGR